MLLAVSNDSIKIKYMADIYASFSTKYWTGLAQELLAFLHQSLELNATKQSSRTCRDAKSSAEKLYARIQIFAIWNLCLYFVPPLWTRRETQIPMKISVDELNRKVSLAEAHHKVTKPKLSDSGSDPASENLSEAAVQST